MVMEFMASFKIRSFSSGNPTEHCVYTPLMPVVDLPTLQYDPLICSQCSGVLNPYARVDYQSRIWYCPFCLQRNSFPRSYSGIGETNLPAELFPTYSTVDYAPNRKIASASADTVPDVNLNWKWGNGLSSSSIPLSSMVSSSSLVSSFSSNSLMASAGDTRGSGPAFVFVLDACSAEEELRV